MSSLPSDAGLHRARLTAGATASRGRFVNVGRLLGHKRRVTTALYAHLDDATLQEAARKAAGVIARAMGFTGDVPPLPIDEQVADSGEE